VILDSWASVFIVDLVVYGIFWNSLHYLQEKLGYLYDFFLLMTGVLLGKVYTVYKVNEKL